MSDFGHAAHTDVYILIERTIFGIYIKKSFDMREDNMILYSECGEFFSEIRGLIHHIYTLIYRNIYDEYLKPILTSK